MYYFEMFDAVMFGIIMLLLIAFAVSVTHATMKVKLEATETHALSINAAMRENNLVLLKDWSNASTYMYALHEAAIVAHCYNPNKPAMEQLLDVLRIEAQMTLDPTISKQAAALINKAKREHGKKIRKAADRKLERVEREYEAQLAVAAEVILKARTISKERLIASANARSELSAFQSIVSQELENFIRLPSVRNACIKAINQQHKAWQEL